MLNRAHNRAGPLHRIALLVAPAAAVAGLGLPCSAQDVRQDWFGVAANASPQNLAGQNPKAVAADLDGNVYVTGRLPNGKNNHMAVWKYDSAGALQPGFPVVWPPLSEPRGADFGGVAVCVRNYKVFHQDGHPPTVDPIPPEIYVVGYGRLTAATGLDFIAMKLDAVGNVLWQPPGPSAGPGGIMPPSVGVYNNDQEDLDDVPVAAAVSSEGDFYVTGVTHTHTRGTDIVTVKFESGSGLIPLVAQPNHYESGVVLFDGPGSGDDAPRAIAIRHTGEALWNFELPIRPDVGPEVFVVGSTTNVASRGEDFITLAYSQHLFKSPDHLGNPLDVFHPHLWHRYYYNPQNPLDPDSPPAVPGGRDVATSLSLAVSPPAIFLGDRVWVTGFSEGSGTGYDYATLCYDMETGVDAWPFGPVGGVRFNNPDVNGPDVPVKIVADAEFATPGKYVYVTGKSMNEFGHYDMLTIAYSAWGDGSPSGSAVWTRPYNRPLVGLDDIPFDMRLVGPERLVVTGASANGFGKDMLTICYNRFPVAQEPEPPLWEISFPQVPDGHDYTPMGLAVARHPDTDLAHLPFVIVVGRTPGLVVGAPQRLGTVQYEQCPGNCPP